MEGRSTRWDLSKCEEGRSTRWDLSKCENCKNIRKKCECKITTTTLIELESHIIEVMSKIFFEKTKQLQDDMEEMILSQSSLNEVDSADIEVEATNQ